VDNTDQFRDLVGGDDGKEINELAKLPSLHFIHPQVFLDLDGKREWEASDLGYKLISLYEDGDDSDEEDDGPRNIDGIYQLLTFLWATSKQYGNPVTLREIPEEGVVTLLCERNAL
jgi:hypothetical protein